MTEVEEQKLLSSKQLFEDYFPGVVARLDAIPGRYLPCATTPRYGKADALGKRIVIMSLAISSSWRLEDGHIEQLAGEVRGPRGGKLRRNRCSMCGGLGHTRRTCGQSVEERRARRYRASGSRARKPVEQPQGEALLEVGEGTTSEGGDEEATTPSCDAV